MEDPAGWSSRTNSRTTADIYGSTRLSASRQRLPEREAIRGRGRRANLLSPAPIRRKFPPVAKIAAAGDAPGPAILTRSRRRPEVKLVIGGTGDGTVATEGRSRTSGPGFYRVGLTVTTERSPISPGSTLTWWRRVEELGTEGGAAAWGFVCQTGTRKSGSPMIPKSDLREMSLRANIGLGFRAPSPRNKRRKMAASRKELVFWARYFNGDVTGWQDGNPVTLRNRKTLRPVRPHPDWFRAPKPQ